MKDLATLIDAAQNAVTQSFGFRGEFRFVPRRQLVFVPIGDPDNAYVLAKNIEPHVARPLAAMLNFLVGNDLSDLLMAVEKLQVEKKALETTNMLLGEAVEGIEATLRGYNNRKDRK